MGIPKLFKDLSPYTERAILGKQRGLEVAVSIPSVVIDGPSLVYEIYQRQLRSLHVVRAPLAYRIINEGLVDLLNQIESYGVDMCGESCFKISQLTTGSSEKIYFDGALPVSKRATRLERLERHKHQLDQFIKSRWTKGMANFPVERPARGRELLEGIDHGGRHNLKALEPPFMVASAIEHLRRSDYGSRVELIPDEAEAGCIMYACRNNVAMLSNDSDLVVFPSASTMNITLILLHTMQHMEQEIGNPTLVTDCLRPSEISRRMKISSLHLFAHQRHLDSSASASVIKRRAQTNPTIDNALYKSQVFIADYPINLLSQMESALPTRDRSVLDPRLSELWSQYRNSRHVINKPTALHMYLPAMFEDTTRESPWAHGSELRQLAYSLLNFSVPSKLRRASLLEYQRRGHRISGVEIDLLSKKDLSGVFEEDTGLLPNVHTGNSAAEIVASWQRLAVKAVQKRRREDGRATFLPAFHLSACIQAFLYSIRLLKQVADLLASMAPTLQLIHQDVLEKLATMPALADLMDATQDLYAMK